MNAKQEKLHRMEELLRFGTALDPFVVRANRAECRGLRIDQTGDCVQNTIYANELGNVGIIASVNIENISERAIFLDFMRLKVPWLEADFPLLERFSEAEACERQEYAIPGCESYPFDPSVVLNHKFGCRFKLQPGRALEGLLLGEGRADLPQDYPDRKRVPVQVIAVATTGESFGTWMNLIVSRAVQRRIADRPGLRKRARLFDPSEIESR